MLKFLIILNIIIWFIVMIILIGKDYKLDYKNFHLKIIVKR
jgi:hypothetical protein